MTNQQAIAVLLTLKYVSIATSYKDENNEAAKMAIEALDMACLALEDLEVEDD